MLEIVLGYSLSGKSSNGLLLAALIFSFALAASVAFCASISLIISNAALKTVSNLCWYN